MLGTVRSYKTEGGYAFVSADDGSSHDIFLHLSELRTVGVRPEVGSRVEFDLEIHPKGLRAKNCFIVPEA